MYNKKKRRANVEDISRQVKLRKLKITLCKVANVVNKTTETAVRLMHCRWKTVNGPLKRKKYKSGSELLQRWEWKRSPSLSSKKDFSNNVGRAEKYCLNFAASGSVFSIQQVQWNICKILCEARRSIFLIVVCQFAVYYTTLICIFHIS